MISFFPFFLFYYFEPICFEILHFFFFFLFSFVYMCIIHFSFFPFSSSLVYVCACYAIIYESILNAYIDVCDALGYILMYTFLLNQSYYHHYRNWVST